MSENGRELALRAFIDDLNRARRAAGPPSYTQIERLSRRLENAAETASGVRVITLARSTTNDILTGDRRDRPRWEWVASFWAVLRLLADQNGIDPGRLGSLEEWRGKYDALVGAAREPGQAGGAWPPSLAGRKGTGTWWDAYRDVVPEWFAPFLDLEPSTGLVRMYEPEYVPGLLQTEEYARATIGAGHPGDSPELIERRVELRLLRQRVLHRPDPLRLWAVLDEHVLSPDACEAATLRGQIAHLLKLCASPHVTLQVRPAGTDGTGAADNPVCVLRLPERADSDVVYLEQPSYGLYPDKPGDVRHYLAVLDRLVAEAPPPEASPGILRGLLDGL